MDGILKNQILISSEKNWSDLFDDNMYDLEKLSREVVDRSCSQLVEFSMDGFGNNELLAHIADEPQVESDSEALAIAANVPKLCRLHLLRNKLTNAGLMTSLNGCLHLESLKLRQYFNVNLEGDSLRSCRDRLIQLRLPNDSSDD
ncbi:hypothetical protein C5167_037238 [Papaver somniferum]|uniref:Uncharacterized protein n=1 Tax=Papaver somniferum TaxID=3469 RepID=A0A4Y7I8C9_PAPSO|nr:hypothetical protein C5167_037238 [Papaver somniferum]